MTRTIDHGREATMSSAEVTTWPTPSSEGEYLSSEDVYLTSSPSVSGQASAKPDRSLRRSLVVKLTELVELDINWDGHGAQQPAPQALGYVTAFLSALPTQVPDPQVMASTTGGILLEWDCRGVELLLNVTHRGFSSAVVVVDDKEVEGSIESVRDALFHALTRLTIQR